MIKDKALGIVGHVLHSKEAAELKILDYSIPREQLEIEPAYLAPIEPSEDMIKEALKFSDDYYGPYESDIEAIYTAMMESRDE